MGAFVVFSYFLAIMVSTTHSDQGLIETGGPSQYETGGPSQYETGGPSQYENGVRDTSVDGSRRPISCCDGWRLGVEMNNIQNKGVVKEKCAEYIAQYMKKIDGRSQYENDVWEVVVEAMDYVRALKSIKTDNDMWIFDIDETALSNLDFYSKDDVYYGSKPFNGTALRAWFESGKAVALKPIRALYDFLINKGIKIVFLSAVDDTFVNIRRTNLIREGYEMWENLTLKNPEEKAQGLRGGAFKSTKRAQLLGQYNIIGNIGDQWSDITGSDVGERTFKVPNPMYYNN